MWEHAAESDLVFIERAPHEQGFADYFGVYIKPKLLELEYTRLNAQNASKKRLPFALVGGVALVLTLIWFWQSQTWLEGDLIWFPIAVMVAGGLFLTIWVHGPRDQYEVDRKQAIIPEVLRFIAVIADFSYEHDGKIAEKTLKASGLFGSWDTYYSEDLVTGTYRGRAIQFAEIELKKGSGKSQITVFKGFILALEMPAWTNEKTIAVRDKGNAMNWLGAVFKSYRNLEKVHFDHAKFEHEFEVYSTSANEARQLISPLLIAAVRMLGELRHAKSIEFGAHDDVFLLKIETKSDLFEPIQVTKTALTTEDSRRFLEELRDVLDLIEIVTTATDSAS